MDPATLKFAKSHEWISLEGEIATVGISEFAVKSLTDIVHVELPDVGLAVEAGKPFGEVESVKAVSDLYAPVSGEITEVNDTLPDDPDKLSSDPYGTGWIVKLRVSEPSQLDGLFDLPAYEQHCASENH